VQTVFEVENLKPLAVSIHRETLSKQHSLEFPTEGDQSRRIPDTSRQRFQALAAAAGKARSPSVERRVDGTSSVDVLYMHLDDT